MQFLNTLMLNGMFFLIILCQIKKKLTWHMLNQAKNVDVCKFCILLNKTKMNFKYKLLKFSNNKYNLEILFKDP